MEQIIYKINILSPRGSRRRGLLRESGKIHASLFDARIEADQIVNQKGLSVQIIEQTPGFDDWGLTEIVI